MSKTQTPPPTEELAYDPELGPGYFIQIRTDFLRSPAFTPTAKVLYEVLLTYAGEGATAWPGQQRLAEHLGVTDRTIRTILQRELIPAGLVTVQRVGLNKTNRYHLHKLSTLPPTKDRKNFPIQSPDRKNLPIKNGNAILSKVETVSVEIESVKTHTETDTGDQAPPVEDAKPPYSLLGGSDFGSCPRSRLPRTRSSRSEPDSTRLANQWPPRSSFCRTAPCGQEGGPETRAGGPLE